MIHYENKISKPKMTESLAAGSTLAALILFNFLHFHCRSGQDELVCINEVEEPQHQAQTGAGYIPASQDPYMSGIVWSVVTASGNASVSSPVS